MGVFVGVSGGFVTHAEQRHDEVATQHGDCEQALHRGVARRQALAVRERGVVVVNDGPAFLQAIHPHARHVHRVMPARAFRRAEVLLGARGPSLEGDRILIRLEEMVEADAAAGEHLRLVQGGVQQGLQGLRRGGGQELPPGGHDRL